MQQKRLQTIVICPGIEQIPLYGYLLRMKLSDDDAKLDLKVALDQSMSVGPTSLEYEQYAASAVEELLMQEQALANIEDIIRLVATNMMNC